MSIKKILLVVVVCLVLAVVVAALVADSRFQVLFSSPRIPHDTLVKPETRAQVVLNVPLAKAIIKKVLLKGINVPDPVIDQALPYEAALVVTPDPVLSELNLTMFVNDRRLAPVLLDKINQIQIPPPFSQWFPDKMAAPKRGLLSRLGMTKMDRGLLTQLKTLWKKPAPTQALQVDGSHLIEAAFDNRDGSAVALIATLAATQGIDIMNYITEGRLGLLANVASLRIVADVTPDNVLHIQIPLECTPETEDAMVKVIAMAFEMGYPQAQGYLKSMGVTLQGRSSIEGKTIKGDYTVDNFDALLAKL